jgi:hypothetical protein
LCWAGLRVGFPLLSERIVWLLRAADLLESEAGSLGWHTLGSHIVGADLLPSGLVHSACCSGFFLTTNALRSRMMTAPVLHRIQGRPVSIPSGASAALFGFVAPCLDRASFIVSWHR